MIGDAAPFHVQVQVDGDVPPMIVRDYAPELDDVRSMLHDVCEHVHDSGSVGLLLVVAGARVHAEVSVELVMLLEQLPAARRACRIPQTRTASPRSSHARGGTKVRRCSTSSSSFCEIMGQVARRLTVASSSSSCDRPAGVHDAPSSGREVSHVGPSNRSVSVARRDVSQLRPPRQRRPGEGGWLRRYEVLTADA